MEIESSNNLQDTLHNLSAVAKQLSDQGSQGPKVPSFSPVI